MQHLIFDFWTPVRWSFHDGMGGLVVREGHTIYQDECGPVIVQTKQDQLHEVPAEVLERLAEA